MGSPIVGICAEGTTLSKWTHLAVADTTTLIPLSERWTQHTYHTPGDPVITMTEILRGQHDSFFKIASLREAKCEK